MYLSICIHERGRDLLGLHDRPNCLSGRRDLLHDLLRHHGDGCILFQCRTGRGTGVYVTAATGGTPKVTWL